MDGFFSYEQFIFSYEHLFFDIFYVLPKIIDFYICIVYLFILLNLLV